MFVDELLNHRDLRSYNEEDVKRVVRDNDKQRFLIAEDPQTGRLKVRANQGHTFVVGIFPLLLRNIQGFFVTERAGMVYRQIKKQCYEMFEI